jgi:hypothetical protein
MKSITKRSPMSVWVRVRVSVRISRSALDAERVISPDRPPAMTFAQIALLRSAVANDGVESNAFARKHATLLLTLLLPR